MRHVIMAHFYYKEKKLSFTKPEEVYKRALQMAKKGRILTFHWRGGYLTKTVLEELLDLIEKAGAEKGKKPRISLNWPQAVIRFGYVDAEIAGSSAAEEVQMEEAVRCILTKIHMLYMLQTEIGIRVTVENLQEKVSVIE